MSGNIGRKWTLRRFDPPLEWAHTSFIHEATKVYEREGSPADFAIFSRVRDEGVDFYLTPNVTARYGVVVDAGTPCERPSKDDLILMVGDEETAWRLLD